MILSINTWWSEKEVFEQLLWGTAILFSLLFIFQTTISIVGGSDDVEGLSDEAIAEDDGIGHQFFTIRNLVAFLTMFGWAGLASNSIGLSSGITVLIATVSGAALVVIMVFLVASASKLKESGTLQMKNALGKSGETYLPIPAKRSGTGKVQIHVQGRLCEMEAMTDEEAAISRGKIVKVTEVLNNNILLVSSNS